MEVLQCASSKRSFHKQIVFINFVFIIVEKYSLNVLFSTHVLMFHWKSQMLQNEYAAQCVSSDLKLRFSLLYVNCWARYWMSWWVMLYYIVCRRVCIFVICLNFFNVACNWLISIAEVDLLLFWYPTKLLYFDWLFLFCS